MVQAALVIKELFDNECSRLTIRAIADVCRNQRSMDTFDYIAIVRHPDVLSRRDVAKPGDAVTDRFRGADRRHNMVSPDKRIRRHESKNKKRPVPCRFALELHNLFDHTERHVAWTLDHSLNACSLRPSGKLASHGDLGQLCGVVETGRTGAKRAANVEAHTVTLQNCQKVVEAFKNGFSLSFRSMYSAVMYPPLLTMFRGCFRHTASVLRFKAAWIAMYLEPALRPNSGRRRTKELLFLFSFAWHLTQAFTFAKTNSNSTPVVLSTRTFRTIG